MTYDRNNNFYGFDCTEIYGKCKPIKYPWFYERFIQDNKGIAFMIAIGIFLLLIMLRKTAIKLCLNLCSKFYKNKLLNRFRSSMRDDDEQEFQSNE